MPVCECSHADQADNTDISKRCFPEIDEILSHYADIEGSLISVLQKTQDVYGYLPEEVLRYISDSMGIAPAKVFGVATFYKQFRLRPNGSHIILLCEGTACHVNSAPVIEEAICEHLNISDGGTTEDGLFTLSIVACLGCCSLAPVMMVKGPGGTETFGLLTSKKVRKILDEIAARERKTVQ